MKAVSVNGGRRRELAGRQVSLTALETVSGVSPTGTVEQSSEDQALVNKQCSLQALTGKTQTLLTTHSHLYREYLIYSAMTAFVVLLVNITIFLVLNI